MTVTILKQFEEFRKSSVFPLLSILDELYQDLSRHGLERAISQNLIWQYWEEKNTGFGYYEDDGKTSCPGTECHALCSVAIARPIADAWQEKNDWYYGKTHSVINFHSKVRLRSRDRKVVGSSCELTASPYLVDEDKKHNSTRIEYANQFHANQFHKSETNMLRLLTIIEANLEMKKLHKKVKEALESRRLKEDR